MFTFTDDPFLERLAERLEGAPDGVHELVARDLEESLKKIIDEQFQSATDPYGQPYLLPRDGGRPMQRTGALRAGMGVRAESSSDGVEVSVTSQAPYGRYLQSGTSRMAARRIVPGSAFLAPKWRGVAVDAYRRALSAWFGQEVR